MGMAIAHNLSAIYANNRNTANVALGKKSIEKLSSGLKINRAGDNASGLAVSEKLRSQTRGLKQATANANDAISLIQTAEGGLNETHAILQRMRELAVQSANGTYQDDTDREAMDLEVQALKSEVDRISSSTEYNKIKLLDGSLGGSSNTTNEYGATFGYRSTAGIGANQTVYNVASNVSGAKIKFTTGASGAGGENATFASGGTGVEVTVNLTANKFYTDDEINDLISNALKDKALTAPAAEIKWSSDAGGLSVTVGVTTTATVGGVRDSGTATLTSLTTTSGTSVDYGNSIKLTANTYGAHAAIGEGRAATVIIKTDVAAGKESVEVNTVGVKGTSGDTISLHLATGVTYTEEDIHNILAKAGYDFEVDITDSIAPTSDATKVQFNVATTAGVTIALSSGAGLGKEQAPGGEGLIFQIGANGTADQRVGLNVADMSSAGLGLSSTNVSTRDNANAAITKFDDAIKTVSLQRAGLGSLQNRLEYTVNNLTTTNENLTAAESAIRDTDMADEVIANTKASILQQASQAMLAQANQAPQSVLQLLG